MFKKRISQASKPEDLDYVLLEDGYLIYSRHARQIDRGAKVAVAYVDPDSGDDVRDLPLVHAACLAIIERSMKVMSAVQQRLYESFKNEFKVLAEIVKDFMD